MADIARNQELDSEQIQKHQEQGGPGQGQACLKRQIQKSHLKADAPKKGASRTGQENSAEKEACSRQENDFGQACGEKESSCTQACL